jgi:hypothetical protein
VPSSIRMTCWVLLLCLAMPGFAQLPRVPDPTSPERRASPAERAQEELQREAAKRQNKERQDALKHDTDKLLEMATELKEYVDKSNEHVLSVEVVKKADEIEKLAHRVREKMKGQ